MKEYDLKDAEEWREYILAEKGGVYMILQPRTLFISNTGGHRVVDVYGIVHRIAPEDVGVIRWKPKNEQKPVKF